MNKNLSAWYKRGALQAASHVIILSCLLVVFLDLGVPLLHAQASVPAAAATPDGQSKNSQIEKKEPGELQKALQEFRQQVGEINSPDGKSKRIGRDKQNAFTGRVYEYVRNDLLDAIPHEVRQRGGDKSLLRRNQFGFTASGPVIFPRLYNGRGKTFFSISYEGTRERISRSMLFTVPTEKQRRGDFSDLVDTAGKPVTIYDPATTRLNPHYDPKQPVSAANLQYLRDPFPGNIIPPERIDAVARQLIALYPQPNVAIGPFLQNNYSINSPFANRADGGILRIDHTLSERQRTGVNLNFSRGTRKAPEYFPGPANSGDPSYFYDTRSFSVVDTFTPSPQTTWDFRLGGYQNRTLSLVTNEETDFPRQLGIKGVQAKGFPNFRFGGYLPLGPPPTSQFRDSNYNGYASAAASVNRKAHTLRVSSLARRNFVNSYSPWAPAGLFSFGRAITGLPGDSKTGNTFAQFQLGLVTRAEESVVLQPSYLRKNYFEMAAKDEYRLRPGLTVNLGLVLKVSTPRTEKYNRQSTVALDRINPANNRPGALIFAGRNGVGANLQPVTARLEPSLGVAVNPWNDRKTVLRFGYSLSYEDYPLVGRGFATQGFNSSPLFTSPNDQLQPSLVLSNGLPANFPLPPFLDPTAANGTDADYLDRSGLLPATQAWHLNAQRELPGALSIELAYQGFRGTHLFTGGLARLNAVPVEALRFGEQLYDDTFRNSLRPYPQYRNFEFGGVYPGGEAFGHFLTVTIDKRLSHGLSGRAIYRFGKQIDNVSSPGAQDPHDLRAEMAVTPYDVAHTLQLSYTYELPLGKGRRFFRETGRLLGIIFNNWSLSGLTTVRGGEPLQIRPLFNRTGGIVPNLRVNVVPGVNSRVANPSPALWFNPAAFSQPADFTLGNAARTYSFLRGPGEQYHHLSLTKRLPLSRDTSLELVAEAFNFINHANWNEPDTRIGSSDSPNLNAGHIIGSTGGRVLQLGMRILF